MAFRDLIRKQRQAGAGILPAVGSAAGATIREAVDIRNILFTKDSLLGALFPNVKGFKADAKAPKTRTSPTSLMSMGTGSSALSDAKLDIISQNTKISAKNSMILPSMARDMNVMRQNIIKLVKLSGGKASTRADMFFMKAAERERAYEAQMQESKAPSPVVTAESETTKEKGGMLGTLLKSLGGILAVVGVGMVAYFSSPEFKNLVDERVIKPLSDNFGEFKDKLIEVGKDFLLVAAGVVAAYVGLKAVAAAAAGKLALLALANPVVLAGAIGAAVGAWLISRDRKKADTVIDIQERKARGEDVSEEEEKKLQEWHRKHSERDQRQFEDLDNMMNPQEGPSAATLFLKRMMRMGVGKGNEALRNRQAPTPVPPEAPAPEPAAAAAPTPTRTDGLSLLNRVMDQEGITDQAIRDRITSLAQIESSMNPNARGPVLQRGMHRGDQAHGLLQIMPKTATEVGFSKQDIKDPEKAAIAGVRYFMKNLNRFEGNLDAATVAHHSGPGGAQRWLKSGDAGTVDLATGLSTNSYLAKVQGQTEMVASTTRIPGSQIASASTVADMARMESMDALSMIPSMLGLMMPKTPSTQAQQVSIPSTIDTDLFDALVMRVTEYS
jgi:hypothetical protein